MSTVCHDWKHTDAGNWDEEYTCIKCGKVVVVATEDALSFPDHFDIGPCSDNTDGAGI